MTTGVEAFDKTIQKTNEWFKDLMYELNWDDQRQAYQAIRVVLQDLRDRLMVDEAVHLGARLPMLVRGFYYEGWNPSRTPDRQIDREMLLANIRNALGTQIGDADPEQVARAVFKLLYHRVGSGESDDIKRVLPPDIEALWPRRTIH